MAERPILFSAPLVRAILSGRKTETRRMVNPAPVLCEDGVWMWKIRGGPASREGRADGSVPTRAMAECPIAVVGDRLWARETWTLADDDGVIKSSLVGRTTKPPGTRLIYLADDEHGADWWRPSIHMPRWAARLFLRVTEIRAERLQSITNDGAKAEGIADRPTLEQVQAYPKGTAELRVFRSLWDSIYGDKPAARWGSDPWVWVIKFEREEPTT